MKETDALTLSLTLEPSRKRGMALAITMMMLVVISMSAVMLWNSTYLETLIAGNRRRAMHAKHSAMSGINHFMAMKVYDSDVRNMLGNRSKGELIEITHIPGTKQFYKVEVSTCCDRNGQILPEDMFRVISTGYYGIKPNVMAESVVEAFIQTREER